MRIEQETYSKFKKKVEDDLRDYPYHLISMETYGLGATIRPDKVTVKNNLSDPVASAMFADEYKTKLVNAIEYVYDKLDGSSKRIIDCCYFQDNVITKDEVMEELRIDKNKYYNLRKNALCKFMKGLGYV